MTTKKLYLSDTDKKIAGVIGGVAEYLEMDSTFLRVIYLAVTILTMFWVGILAYIAAWMVMPRRPATGGEEKM